MRFIVHNKARFNKHIVSGRGPGADVYLLELEDTMSEYNYIGGRLTEAITSGIKQNELAVLHRNNIQPWEIANLLRGAVR